MHARLPFAMNVSYLNLMLLVQGGAVVCAAQTVSFVCSGLVSAQELVSAAQGEPLSLTLENLEVVGEQASQGSEGTGSYSALVTRSANGLLLSPRETPQSTSQLTRQQIDDMGLNSLREVMRYAPGVTVSTTDSEHYAFYARGFPIDRVQFDGVPTTMNARYDAGISQADMAIYDRIEVISGANGLLNGTGSPSATLNLVRKRPTPRFSGHLSLGAGSWDHYRSEVDLGGPLTQDANLRGRLVTAYEDQHSFQDRYEQKKTVHYGIIEADLNEQTLLSVGFDYLDSVPKGASWAGMPLLYSDGSKTRFSRSFNPAADWSSWSQYNRTAFITLERALDLGWNLKLAYNHRSNGYHGKPGSAGGGYPDPVNGAGATLFNGRYYGETKQDSLDAYLSGPFQMLGREHELVVGMSSSRMERNNSVSSAGSYDPRIPDIHTWSGDIARPGWDQLNMKEQIVTHENGAYATVRLRPLDDLSFILGGRLTYYKESAVADTYAGPAMAPAHQEAKRSGYVLPYAGAVYDLNTHYSLYASYTEIFNPQPYRDSSNRALGAEEGESYELGLKGEFYDGRLNTSLALFEVNQSHHAEPTNELIPGTANQAYRTVNAKSKGLELQISGELMPRWNIQAGYTHRVTRDAQHQKVSTLQPEDLFSLYSTYHLSGRLDPLTLGGGVRWQSKIFAEVTAPDGSNERYTQPGYALVDLMSRYQVTPKLSLGLNLNNLLDKKYYSNLGFYNTGNYGEPRNFMLSSHWEF